MVTTKIASFNSEHIRDILFIHENYEEYQNIFYDKDKEKINTITGYNTTCYEIDVWFFCDTNRLLF